MRQLNEDLQEARLAAGLLPLTGTGIVLRLEDSTQPTAPERTTLETGDGWVVAVTRQIYAGERVVEVAREIGLPGEVAARREAGEGRVAGGVARQQDEVVARHRARVVLAGPAAARRCSAQRVVQLPAVVLDKGDPTIDHTLAHVGDRGLDPFLVDQTGVGGSKSPGACPEVRSGSRR